MFAPKVAKPQTKATASSTNGLARQSSTLVAPRPGLSTVEEVLTLQRTIGNQATLRLLAQRTPSQAGPRGHNEQKAYPASLTAPGTNSRVSWDFSKVPLFPPDRASRPQARSCISALSLPNIIQPKLVVGEANDPLEHEADRVADQVMSGLAVSVADGPPQISRKCTDCEGEEKLQKKPAQSQTRVGEAPAIVHEALRSPGQPLDAATRAFMEPRFGHDFSKVRVYSGLHAEQSARDMNARAYTVGQHIVFAAGQFAPATEAGRHLLAHELTHVVQQRSFGAVPMIQRKLECNVEPVAKECADAAGSCAGVKDYCSSKYSQPADIDKLHANAVRGATEMKSKFPNAAAESAAFPRCLRHGKGDELGFVQGPPRDPAEICRAHEQIS